MTGTGYDWTAFATGFGIALLLTALLRWRKGRRSDLTAPTDAAVKAQLAAGLPSEIRSQVLRLKAEGKTIEAIKLVGERTGCDLKAAKDAVDGLR
jgi:ribosomal protein L7/L12